MAGDEALTVRVMHDDEYDEMRAVAVAAFDDPSIGELLDRLRGSWAWRDDLVFVAERDGKLVGQVVYTLSILDAPDQLVEVLLLSPVGIRPDLHRTGIGTELIESSLAVIATRSEPAVFLEGDPRYYSRFDFVEAGNLGFRKPSLRIPDPAFQVRKLPSWVDGLCGTLVYQDAFWLTDSVGLR